MVQTVREYRLASIAESIDNEFFSNLTQGDSLRMEDIQWLL